ncbi:MAG TPA: beta-propeller domain-containing protein [Candidatus Bathyarchaeia archaeon]|nr:beta-propeller domain-containing protein [Candidatus Bathyarchaeia archaeon]
MPDEPNQNLNSKYLWVVLAAAILVAVIVFGYSGYQRTSNSVRQGGTGITGPKEKISEVKKFASEQEFKDYLEKAKNVSAPQGGRGGGEGLEAQALPKGDSSANASAAVPERVSETNVQVAGIDEPDAVKTDGKEIFFSSEHSNVYPLAEKQIVCEGGRSGCAIPPQPADSAGIKAIDAFPPEKLNIDSNISKRGDLLLIGSPGEAKKTLIVIPKGRYFWSQNESKIFGYDVTDPGKPKEIWNIELKNAASIAGAREYKGKIYIAIKTDFAGDGSCQLTPFAVKGSDFSLKCTDIYHPAAIVPTDAVYTAMIIDPSSGGVEKNVSFTGTSDFNSSVVYMSPTALYLSYYNPGDFVKALAVFFAENKNLGPDWLEQKLKNLDSYDISTSAKMTEIQELIGRYQNSLSNDDRLKMQNEMANSMGDFLARHRRDLDSTGIVKINVNDLSIDSAGSVPGKLLNQFSLDEYEGDLRAATTVGENFLSWGFGFGTSSSENTANDVYILGDKLKTEGSVIDLGRGERIYAVRFIEDNGYVVTFRRTDPLYVLDLSDPMNPEKKGELKIPGYSSYLHPIAKDKILGAGEEDGRVKVSLFDVGDPSSPREISKYNLDEYWSEISETHHAFLLDAKHQIFFLPGSKGGYIFSYAGDDLKIAKAVSEIQSKRVIYIDNFFYVIGEDRLVVFDENSWEKVGDLEL